MTLRDILNPWRALREARREWALWREVATDQHRRVQQLHGVIDKGHYRDPKTGRLGQRGVVPKGLYPND